MCQSSLRTWFGVWWCWCWQGAFEDWGERCSADHTHTQSGHRRSGATQLRPLAQLRTDMHTLEESKKPLHACMGGLEPCAPHTQLQCPITATRRESGRLSAPAARSCTTTAIAPSWTDPAAHLAMMTTCHASATLEKMAGTLADLTRKRGRSCVGGAGVVVGGGERERESRALLLLVLPALSRCSRAQTAKRIVVSRHARSPWHRHARAHWHV